MSSISYKMLGASNVGCVIQFVVNSEREKLADYVRRIISEKGLNYREVARRSGDTISHSIVFDIVSGRSKDVKTSTLIGLAKGLGVTEDELFAVARGEKQNGARNILEEIGVMFDGWDELSDEDKARTIDDLHVVAEMMQRRRRQSPAKTTRRKAR